MINENKILLSHLDDLLYSIKKGRKYAFSSFLNIEQLSSACSLAYANNANYKVFGGYEDAERCLIGFGCDDIPETYMFPITTISFSLKNNDSINHRNVLGSIMSLGVKRECIGDIVFKDGFCYVFVDSKISDFLLTNFNTISSMHIDPQIETEQIDFVKEFENINITVSSLRLDCIVCELVKKSRTASAEIIESGLVFVNGLQCQKKDKNINENDVISIRRIGKFKIGQLLGYTKKNRVKLNILKYI